MLRRYFICHLQFVIRCHRANSMQNILGHIILVFIPQILSIQWKNSDWKECPKLICRRGDSCIDQCEIPKIAVFKQVYGYATHNTPSTQSEVIRTTFIIYVLLLYNFFFLLCIFYQVHHLHKYQGIRLLRHLVFATDTSFTTNSM